MGRPALAAAHDQMRHRQRDNPAPAQRVREREEDDQGPDVEPRTAAYRPGLSPMAVMTAHLPDFMLTPDGACRMRGVGHHAQAKCPKTAFGPLAHEHHQTGPRRTGRGGTDFSFVR